MNLSKFLDDFSNKQYIKQLSLTPTDFISAGSEDKMDKIEKGTLAFRGIYRL